MKTLSTDQRKIEGLLYLLVWLLVFSIPYFAESGGEVMHWRWLVGQWSRLLIYLVVFLVNVYVLVPRFLFEKRYRDYLLFVGLAMFVVILISTNLHFLPGNAGIPAPPGGAGPGPMNPGGRGMPKPPFIVAFDNIILVLLQ